VENVVEVRYAGVGIGRSTLLRDWTAVGAFIGFAEPMPTGTPLVLKGDGIEQAARVVEAIESADLAVAGMRVQFVASVKATAPAPAPSPVSAAPAVVAAPAPVPEAVQAALPAAVEAAAPAAVETATPVAVEIAALADPETPHAEVETATAEVETAPVAGPADAEGLAGAPHSTDGEAGSNAGSGKRRRRRK